MHLKQILDLIKKSCPGFEYFVCYYDSLFALIYKFMPRATIAWRDVWIGAAVTAFLFAIGKSLLGLYLGKASVASGFGAAGLLVILLLWVYYGAQIFLLGADFTWVYSNTYGSKSAQGR